MLFAYSAVREQSQLYNRKRPPKRRPFVVYLILRFPTKGRTVDISSYECARFAAGFDITRESHKIWQYRRAPQKCDCAVCERSFVRKFLRDLYIADV